MKRKSLSIIAIAFCVIFAALSFTSCAEEKSGIVGTWVSLEASDTSYTFKKDNNGILEGEGYSIKFTYEENENKLDITFEGADNPQHYKYKIENNILKLTDNDSGSTLQYVKKK